jgi:hypothetical protein
MTEWIGVLPVIGTGSLEGFAFGVLASGVCFLALTAPRRPRYPDAAARYDVTHGPREDRSTVRLAATVPEDLMPAKKPADPLRNHRDDNAGSRCDAAAPLAGRGVTSGAVSSLNGAGAVPTGRPVLSDGAGRTLSELAAPPGPVTSADDAGLAPEGTAARQDREQGKAGGHRAAHPAGAWRGPRHAAPASSLVSKMSSLFRARSLADDSRG